VVIFNLAPTLKELLERESKLEQSKILVVFEKEADSLGISEPYEHVNACWQEFVKGCLEPAP
jgi:hypothetical protein